MLHPAGPRALPPASCSNGRAGHVRLPLQALASTDRGAARALRVCTGAGSSSSRQAAGAVMDAAGPSPTDAAAAGSAEPTGNPASGGGGATAAMRTLHGRIARFAASKQQSQDVVERQRPLQEYMALPASQYSVLDARRIERIDDTTFVCYVGGLSFFGFSVEPVITVSVTVEERGCTIRLLSCRLQGSRSVEDINDKFTATMTNVVRWSETPDPALKQISSTTSIEVAVQVPGWFSLAPISGVEAVGSGVMRSTLNVMVPRFLAQLQDDYAAWATGDGSRRPIGDGSDP